MNRILFDQIKFKTKNIVLVQNFLVFFIKYLKFEKIEPLFQSNDFNNEKVIKAYTKFIYDIATLLNPNITNMDQLNNDIEKMVRLEKLMRLNVNIL